MVLRKRESRKPPPYRRLEQLQFGSFFICNYYSIYTFFISLFRFLNFQATKLIPVLNYSQILSSEYEVEFGRCYRRSLITTLVFRWSDCRPSISSPEVPRSNCRPSIGSPEVPRTNSRPSMIQSKLMLILRCEEIFILLFCIV